jgi:hypothetical protein
MTGAPAHDSGCILGCGHQVKEVIYNLGGHLTGDCIPGIDPTVSDLSLTLCLQENQSLAMSQLDEVISKYAMMQDKSEEGKKKGRIAKLPQVTSFHSADPASPKPFWILLEPLWNASPGDPLPPRLRLMMKIRKMMREEEKRNRD